jgi:gamma-glutamylputrescine oxidase
MNLSYWERETYFKNIDIAIIGSGIVGLNAALNLKIKDPGLKIIILERTFLPSGASTKNAGFACFGSPSELLADLKKIPEQELFGLVEKRFKGLERLRKNLSDKSIDYQNNGGYELFDKEPVYSECIEQLPFLNRQLAAITGEKNIFTSCPGKIADFGFKGIKGMILNKAEGQIDTGKMMQVLIDKVQQLGVIILNGITIKGISDHQVEIEDGWTIEAKKIIVATNGFARKLLSELDVSPARAQVLVTSPIPGLAIKGTFHYDQGFYYFRNINNRVLFGGGRNLDIAGENTDNFGLTDRIQQRLEELLKTIILPGYNYTIEQRWSGIMGLGERKVPIVKKLGNNLYCAVRMGGMGIAIGSLTGEEVADLVLADL